MFTLTIKTENAAFDRRGGSEIARLLAVVATHVRGRDLDADSGTLRDVNGNTVGRWEVATIRTFRRRPAGSLSE